MGYFFTSESVSEGHPDKIADQISDALLDHFLALDSASKVACETLVTTGQVVVAGEVKSEAYVDVQAVTRRVINRIGYTKSEYMFDGKACGILSALHEQSGDINRGVERADPLEQGAGDQRMMFGYATEESETLLPVTLDLAHALVKELAAIRKEGKQMTYLRPDAKAQVTIEYDRNHRPRKAHTIVLSTQHDEFILPSCGIDPQEADRRMQATIQDDIRRVLLPRLRDKSSRFDTLLGGLKHLLVNPTGKFVIGGPHGDTGLTGRKIIVDTYGGRGAHGGGAFSGKDPSKVDRSAAYAARHIAKNLVAAGLARQVLVQISYAIGVARPTSLYVNTYGTSNLPLSDGQIARRLFTLFDLRPRAIEERLQLRHPIYEETAAYGHMGRSPRTATKTFIGSNGREFARTVELFTWEKLDMVDTLKRAFSLP